MFALSVWCLYFQQFGRMTSYFYFVFCLKKCLIKNKLETKNSQNLISLPLASLSPTSAAARQYSFRTYCQVQRWLENYINPPAWGWILSNRSLLPVPTDLPPAPDKLMRIFMQLQSWLYPWMWLSSNRHALLPHLQLVWYSYTTMLWH